MYKSGKYEYQYVVWIIIRYTFFKFPFIRLLYRNKPGYNVFHLWQNNLVSLNINITLPQELLLRKNVVTLMSKVNVIYKHFTVLEMLIWEAKPYKHCQVQKLGKWCSRSINVLVRLRYISLYISCFFTKDRLFSHWLYIFLIRSYFFLGGKHILRILNLGTFKMVCESTCCTFEDENVVRSEEPMKKIGSFRDGLTTSKLAQFIIFPYSIFSFFI